jgi:hypothetical protein
MRKLFGALSLLLAVSNVGTALSYLEKAVKLRLSAADQPYKALETEEYFFTFCFSTMFAAFLFWWGIRQFRRKQSLPEDTED